MFVELVMVNMLLAFMVLLNWRVGLYGFLVVGFIQDPFRKLMINQPVYLTASVVAVFTLMLLGARSDGFRFSKSIFWNVYPNLKLPIISFAVLVVIQALHAFVKTGSIFIFAIGLLAYLLPLVTLVFMFSVALEKDFIIKFLYIYLILAGLFVSGVIFQAAGFDWSIIGSVGSPLYFYTDRVQILYAGFMRSSEISAWHGAMAVMIGLTLYTIAPSGLRKQLLIVMSSITLIAIILTGRRKALGEVGIFVICGSSLAFRWFSQSTKTYIQAIVLCLAINVSLFWYFDVGVQLRSYNVYVARSWGIVEISFDRLEKMAVGSLKWAVLHNGLFGVGAGLGSQGAQHFGGMKTGYSAEGGIAKVISELGVPGLILLFWVIVSIARSVWQALHVETVPSRYQMLIIGLSSILIANFFNFAIAHQVYGDLFVVLLCGTTIAFILAIPFLTDSTVEMSDTQYALQDSTS